MKLDSTTDRMLPTERRAAFSLASIYATRMLGLFMLLPVMALYAEQLRGSTPLLVGIAIGIYGLTQALLQIPFGWLSDRFGRKRIIVIGLLLFAAGSVVAALSSSIYGVIAGRALQGSGAIAAAVMALAADLSRENQRSKMMAVIGASIGGSFVLALIVGPGIYSSIGGQGLFYVIAVLAVVALLALWRVVPDPGPIESHSVPRSEGLKEVLLNLRLLQLNIGILCLHAMLTAGFIVIPILLRDHYHFAPSRHWMVYLAVMLLAIALMLPVLIMGERQQRVRRVQIYAVVITVKLLENHQHERLTASQNSLH